MKIDIKFSGLDKLMKKMGANHLSWNSGKSLSKLELQQLYTPEGIEKSLDDIEMDENGHMFIDNAPVVLFIKDTWNEIYKLKNYPKGPNMKRFHILGNCKTIEQMKKKNRYDRYSFTADQSGKFSVWGFRDRADRRKIQTIAELGVCTFCIGQIKYNGFDYKFNKNSNKSQEIRDKFSIKEYFTNNVQTLINKPKYSEYSYPDPNYSDTFKSIASELKKLRNYTCEKCKVDLSQLNHRQYLHAHHIDGNSGNNAPSNIQILCVCCHADEGSHILNLPKFKKDYDKCLQLKD